MIKDVLIKISNEFQKERAKHEIPGKPPPKVGTNLTDYIDNKVPKIFEKVLGNKLRNLEVHSSSGKGNYATTPWICILDPKICASKKNGRGTPEEGFYPVYLFTKDEKKILFALAQGEKGPRDRKPKELEIVLQSNAIHLREILPDYKKFFHEVKKITIAENDPIRKRWVLSAAFGKIYQTINLPKEKELKNDVINMIHLYKDAINRGGLLLTGKVKHYKDTNFNNKLYGFEKKVIKHINKEKEIIHNCDPKFINKIKKDSNYTCQACGLKFDKLYGNYSKKKDFIEAHHIEPKAKTKKKVKVGEKIKRTAKDFAMLCANCHRMIHRFGVPSLDIFKKKILPEYIKFIGKL